MKGLLVIPALVGAAALWAAVDEDAGLRKSWQLRSDLRAAQQRIEALRAENEALAREAEALERDPFATERAIREDLGFARPDETIVRFAPAVPTTPRFD